MSGNLTLFPFKLFKIVVLSLFILTCVVFIESMIIIVLGAQSKSYIGLSYCTRSRLLFGVGLQALNYSKL